MLIIKDSRDSDCIYLLVFEIEAFAVCENYSPPEEGFNPRDLHRLLEKVGSPSGGSDLGKNSLLLHIQDHKLTCAVLSSTLSDYSFLNKKLSPEMVNLTFLGKTNSYFYCSSLLKESAIHDDTLQIAAVVLSKNLREPMANLRGLLTSVSSYCQRSFSQSILKSPNNLSQIQTRQTHHDDVETQSCDEYLLNQQYLCSCLL